MRGDVLSTTWDHDGRAVVFRLRVARGEEEGLVETLIDIDLQSFFEATLPRAFAEIAVVHGRVLLLEADSRAIGACVVVRDWHHADRAAIVSFGLMPAWRGRGHGHRFLQWALDALADEGFTAVSIMVGGDNRNALALYTAMGFERVGEGVPDAVSGERAYELCLALTAKRVVRAAAGGASWPPGPSAR